MVNTVKTGIFEKMRRSKEESENIKKKICEMKQAGIASRNISQEIGISVPYVDRILKEMTLETKDSKSLDIPALDPTKPLGPQYEAIGAAILVEAARKGEISTKQIQASSQLVRMGQREKTPPPAERKLEIILDEIDVLEDDKYHKINVYNYEVKP